MNSRAITVAAALFAGLALAPLCPPPAAAEGDGKPSRPVERPRSLRDGAGAPGSLRAEAAKRGLYFGSMMDSGRGNGWETEWVKGTLGGQFNLLVPGTQLKWSGTHPERGVFSFAAGDELVGFARAHGMKVRGHTLVWGMANPAWLGNGPARSYTTFTAKELEAILVEHIRTVMGHYREKFPGVVKWWDVTNELMGWNHRFNSDGILWSKIGQNRDRADYVRIAFRTARAADPDAVLCMNDTGNEGSVPERTRNMFEAVKALKAEGVPIDCVGMEAHVDVGGAPSYDTMVKVMRDYAGLGVQVQITEFDIRAPRSNPDWQAAAAAASDYVRACVDSPNCTAFNIWGFSQVYHIGSSGRAEMATMLPWDEQNRQSPVFAAMQRALAGER